MQLLIRWVVLLMTLAIILSCNKARDGQIARESEAPKPPSILAQKGVAPNSCRIIGTVIAIDSETLSSGTKDPCSKVPCRATVKVDSVLGYGQGFTGPLSVGKTVAAQFKFTLSPTKDLFPGMNLNLPGLQLNSRFRADMKSGPAIDLGDGGTKHYVIEIYHKLN